MKHEKEERQERITRDKEKAYLWADNRRIRRALLIFAQEVTNAYSLVPELESPSLTSTRRPRTTTRRTPIRS